MNYIYQNMEQHVRHKVQCYTIPREEACRQVLAEIERVPLVGPVTAWDTKRGLILMTARPGVA